MSSSFSRSSTTLVGLLVYFTSFSIFGQETPITDLPGLKEKAIVLNIVARIIERNENELWTSQNSKVTIPGRPVTIKLIGNNVVVLAQFTPYQQPDGKKFLLAQGQVWVDTKDEGIRYQTTLQTIPIDYGEQIYFFPLGPKTKDGQPQIEIRLELHPFIEEPKKEEQPAHAPEDKTQKVNPQTTDKSTGESQKE